MKMKKTIITLACMLYSCFGFAQNSGGGFSPTFTNNIDEYSINGYQSALSLSSYTMKMWVKVSGDGVICSQSTNSTFQSIIAYHLEYSGSNFIVKFSTNNGLSVSSLVATAPKNVWLNVAVTYDNVTGTASIYINGNLHDASIVSPDMNLTAPLVLGGNGTILSGFSGLIDEFYIYNVVLSPANILSSMCSKTYGASFNPIVYYDFDKPDILNGTIFNNGSGGTNLDLHTIVNFVPTFDEGAPVGDISSYTVTANEEKVLTNPNGSSVSIDHPGANTHLYAINKSISNTSNHSLSGGLDTNFAFGVFNSSQSYTLKYAYGGNAVLDGSVNESKICLLSSTSTFYNDNPIKISGENNLNLIQKEVFLCDASGDKQYAAGFDNINNLAVLPGSGKSLLLDGVNDHVTLSATDLPSGNASRTMEVWFKTSTVNKTLVNYGASNSATSQRCGLYIRASGVLAFIGQGNDLDGISAVNDGEWHHGAATYDGTTIRLYVDGKLETTKNTTLNTKTDAFVIGRRVFDNTEYFNGELDELRIWNKALSNSELIENMCLKTKFENSNYCNLVAYYKFDGGSTTTIYDSKGLRDGTMQNGVASTSSGAPIGDYTNYISGVTVGGALNLTSPEGEVLQAKLTSGTANILYIYYVDGETSVTNASTGIEKISPLGYWGVKVFGSNAAEYEVVYDYDGHLGITNEASLVLASRANNAGTQWNLESSAILDASANTLTLGGQTGTQFILGSSSINPLPMELMNLNAKFIDDNVVEVQWGTISESNTMEFWIERSKEGALWNNIGKIEAMGNSNQFVEYSFKDFAPIKGNSYYRIVGVDFNGEKSISKAVYLPQSGNFVTNSLYPNPTNGTLYLNINNKKKGEVKLYNSLGKDISKEVEWFVHSENKMQANFSGLPNGIYTIQFQNITKRFIKIN